MNTMRCVFKGKGYVFLFLLLLTFIFPYLSCQQSMDETTPSQTMGENWCRVYSEENVQHALKLYEEESKSEGFRLLNITDIGQIAVIEDDGSFKGDSGASIAKVTRSFYSIHPDNFDFLTVYSNYYLSKMDDAFAWHINISQHVKGIGASIIDYTSGYGSSGRLKGFQLMNDVNRYPNNPYTDVNQGMNAFEVLAHEMCHQWAAHLRFANPDGGVNHGLLGVQGAHWSYWFEGDLDYLYGHRWRNNGNGTFSDLGACQQYGQLTLYTMGMLAPQEVEPFLFIDNASVSKDQFCSGPGAMSGTARTIDINNIMQVEGPRIPDYSNAQKDYTMAFILVVKKGTQPTAEELQWLDTLRLNYPAVISELTNGRGTVDTNISTLAPPTGLHITRISRDQAFLSGLKIVQLAWDPYSHGQLQGYNIYYSKNDATYVKSNSSPVPDISYTVSGLDGNEDYSFRVTVVLTTGEESRFSEAVYE